MQVNGAVRALLISVGAMLSVSAMAADSSVESLTWLAGCWQAEKGDAGSGEHWLPPAGGTMLGVSRTVKNGKTVEFEFMQLRTNAEGKLALIALPSGQQGNDVRGCLCDCRLDDVRESAARLSAEGDLSAAAGGPAHRADRRNARRQGSRRRLSNEARLMRRTCGGQRATGFNSRS